MHDMFKSYSDYIHMLSWIDFTATSIMMTSQATQDLLKTKAQSRNANNRNVCSKLVGRLQSCKRCLHRLQRLCRSYASPPRIGS